MESLPVGTVVKQFPFGTSRTFIQEVATDTGRVRLEFHTSTPSMDEAMAEWKRFRAEHDAPKVTGCHHVWHEVTTMVDAPNERNFICACGATKSEERPNDSAFIDGADVWSGVKPDTRCADVHAGVFAGTADAPTCNCISASHAHSYPCPLWRAES